jgi:hypothetical protein
LEQSLTNAGLAFEVAVFDSAASPKLDLAALLWNADGTGRFRGYFM